MLPEKAVGLKKRIHAGEKIFGVAVPVDTSREELEAILEKAPYDFVSIDSQHSALNEERVTAFGKMAEELDTHLQFRIKHTRQAYMIGNYLDLGPCGVEVPQTELDSTVDEALHSFYYPPEGGRSFGGRARRGVKDIGDPIEYGKWWNSFGVLWMQIESVEATTRAHLLARPGVDCLSIGPTDLMVSLRAHPHSTLKTVDDCIAYIARGLEGTSIAVCHRNGTPDTREKYADMGVRVFLESP